VALKGHGFSRAAFGLQSHFGYMGRVALKGHGFSRAAKTAKSAGL
jgi:hypothetical protein